MSDEEACMLEQTLKRPAISPAQPEEPASLLDTSLAIDTYSESSHTSTEQAPLSEQAEDVPVQGEPETEQRGAKPPQLVEQVIPSENEGDLQVAKLPQKRGFLQRLFAVFFRG